MLLQRLLVLICILGFASGQATLPADEVEALKAVGKTLGKTDWDFSVDPCSESPSWVSPNATNSNAVQCDCTFANSTICHVTRMVLRSQNLTGSLPWELVRLPFLQNIGLDWNYLNGSIPPEWGSMKLVNIYLIANRLTGPIPKTFGNITTLRNLYLEGNQLSGPIPPELGALPRIEKLILKSNYLTGEIPATLSNLSTLKDFQISDNTLTGEIPDFIQNWINIERLVIQASGLTGPIPPGIASLTKLTDLRISDLKGNESTLPFLNNTLETLILRSCNILGELLPYIGEMTKLKILDLSFNKFTGPIPETFSGLVNTSYIYLSGNSLSGPVPPWMLEQGHNIDLSYNNFTSEGLDQSRCQQRNTNMFASSKGNTSGTVSCLASVPCMNEYYSSLHINCGGTQVFDVERTVYEADTEPGGPSKFHLSEKKWGFSSTGHFIGDDNSRDYISSTSQFSDIEPNYQLYTDARLSPLSLTYYSFCLMNRNYNVTLHFRNIPAVHGRRVFDIYIQGTKVLPDFKIENGLNEASAPITRSFTAVVSDHTLDIRFYWAGKGTVGIPDRSVYGPLISAISVTPEFPPNGNRISAGGIVGIVVAVLFTAILFLAMLWWKCRIGSKNRALQDLKGLDHTVGSFTISQIRAATNNFDPASKIGEGGFGPVYKGYLPDGTLVAVKQLSSKSKQGNREFVNEIGMISAVQHPHLVKLYGSSAEDNELLLVYEYMENNSLARALFGPKEQQLHLDWPTRHRICIGIAQGLAYLHEESNIKIVHRDIKATNVLLDKCLVPKISDFGLAKLHEEDNTHISTRVAGTFGYMAPEYALRGYLTDKADVYSFGVVLLEIVSGRSNIVVRPNEDTFCLLDWVDFLKKKGRLLELVDSRLGSNFDENEIMTVINVALLCTKIAAMRRPSMSVVVSMLEGKISYNDFVADSSRSRDEEFEWLDDDESKWLVDEL